MWIYHAPPPQSPISWSGERYFGDSALEGWIVQYQPDIVFCVAGAARVDRIGQTWVFNAGKQIGEMPTSTRSTASRQAAWFSFEGAESINLDAPLDAADPGAHGNARLDAEGLEPPVPAAAGAGLHRRALPLHQCVEHLDRPSPDDPRDRRTGASDRRGGIGQASREDGRDVKLISRWLCSSSRAFSIRNAVVSVTARTVAVCGNRRAGRDLAENGAGHRDIGDLCLTAQNSTSPAARMNIRLVPGPGQQHVAGLELVERKGRNI